VKQKRFRWYWLVSLLLFLELFIVPLLPMAFRADPDRFIDDHEELFDLFMAGQIAVFIIAVIWTTWLCPFIHARDLRAEWRHSPKLKLRGLTFYLWAPPLVALVNAVALTIGTVTGWMFTPVSPAALACFWCLAILSIVAAVFLRYFLKRIMIRQAQERELCFPCGYCVRGVASDTCPECGEPIPHDTVTKGS